MMDALRHTGRARPTELIGPGENDATVRMDAEQLLVADYSEEELQAMIDRTRAAAGAEGAVIQADLDAYVAGINQYIEEARSDPAKLPAEYRALGKAPADWKATDTVAIASLIGGIFGKGGGGEARVAQALAAAEARFGVEEGRRVLGDFTALDDPESPVTTTIRFPFDDPGPVDPAAVAKLDAGSLEDRDPVTDDGDPLTPRRGARRAPAWLRSLRRTGVDLAAPAAPRSRASACTSCSAAGATSPGARPPPTATTSASSPSACASRTAALPRASRVTTSTRASASRSPRASTS